MFRSAIRRGTLRGLEAKGYMDRGELVPDDVTVAMVMDRLRAGHRQWDLLDGFPRTLAQAQALDRDCGQRVDRSIKPSTWAFRTRSSSAAVRPMALPGMPGVVPRSIRATPVSQGNVTGEGGELYQRADDTLETAKRRAQVYFDQTTPVIELLPRTGSARRGRRLQGDWSSSQEHQRGRPAAPGRM